MNDPIVDRIVQKMYGDPLDPVCEHRVPMVSLPGRGNYCDPCFRGTMTQQEKHELENVLKFWCSKHQSYNGHSTEQCPDLAKPTVKRGASNSNTRGNTTQRAARKQWLLVTFQSDEGEGTVRCFRCGTLLDWFTMTVDKIIPQWKGGTYRRTNIRPCCLKCNTTEGAAMASAKKKAASKR